MILFTMRLPPSNNFDCFEVHRLMSSNALVVLGHGRAGSWQCRLDELLVTGLYGNDLSFLLQSASAAAEHGMPPGDFAAALCHNWSSRQASFQQSQQRQQAAQAQMYNQQQQYQPAFQPGQFNPGPFDPGTPQAPNDAKLWEKPERLEEEIIAYRSWFLDWEVAGWTLGRQPIVVPILHSTNRTCAWPSPVQHADQPPAAMTKTGIYAVGVEERFAQNFSTYVREGNVWGEVALSGIVVEGQVGYRAETCTIRRLWIGGQHRINFYLELADLRRLLGERYQCDVGEVVQPTIESARRFEAEQAARRRY